MSPVGRRLAAEFDRLVAVGEEWAFFKGVEAVPPGWNDLGFDDSSWLRGPTGIGYSDNDDATVLSDMRRIDDDPETVEDESNNIPLLLCMPANECI